MPIATAICAATLRVSVNGGSRGAEESLRTGEFAASARAAASIMLSVMRRAPEATTPRPMAGKMKTLLHCATEIFRSPKLTGAKGEPVATRARASVQWIKSSAVASEFTVGFDSGKTDEDCCFDLSNHVSQSDAPVGGGEPSRKAAFRLGIDDLFRSKVFPSRMQKSIFVNHPKVPTRILFGYSLALHCLTQSIGNTDTG